MGTTKVILYCVGGVLVVGCVGFSVNAYILKLLRVSGLTILYVFLVFLQLFCKRTFFFNVCWYTLWASAVIPVGFNYFHAGRHHFAKAGVVCYKSSADPPSP